MQGTVKWFDVTKGYGFVARSDGGGDVFIHHTGIGGEGYRSLEDGQTVEFDLEEGDRGPKAVNCVVVPGM